MWQRFTEKARKIVFYAQEEAGAVGQNQVGPEHLLAGLVRDDDSVAVRLLVNLNISLEALRSELAERMARSDGTFKKSEMQLTEGGKRAIDKAYVEARRLGNNYIGTEHLLLGLLGGVNGSELDHFAARVRSKDVLESDHLASQLLREFGVDPVTARDAVRQLQEPNPTSPPIKQHHGQEQAMWQWFTQKARLIVFYAQEDARALGESYVSTEHLLSGLLRDQYSAAVRILDDLNISRESILAEISRQVTQGPGRNGNDIPLTPRAKRVVDLAYDEARLLGNTYIGSEHLLLGLLREGEGLAGRVLKKVGLELEPLRKAVRESQMENPSADETAAHEARSGNAPAPESVPRIDPSPPPIDRIAHTIIQQAIREGSSDIHIEQEKNGVRVRSRIDGVLNEIMTVPAHVKDELIARFKTMADLNAARHDIFQHGILHLRSEGMTYELTITSLPGHNGENVVIRIPHELPVGLKTLGLLEGDLATLHAWMARRSGLVLLAGSTGQGKTTTAYNLLREFTGPEDMAVAVQHPLDQQMPGVISYSVDPKSGMTLETVLEAVLRNQADVVSVGRVLSHPWDEAFSLVLNTALAGPLVLLEYHAASAAKALNGWVNHSSEFRLINDSLIGVVAQSLVRRICENCKHQADQVLSSEIRDKARMAGFDVPAEAVFHEGAGCETCRGTGYKGRTGLFELLPWNNEMADAMRRQASAEDLTKLAVAHGMKTRFADGIRKATHGLTTVAEVERAVGRQG